MKVAIVHDWLYVYGGAERVLEAMLNCFPDADIFSLFDNLKPEQRFFIKEKPVKTSFLQKMPLIKKRHSFFLPLMPWAIEKIDLSGYDLIISSSHAVACGVKTSQRQFHVCYCQAEHMRYLFDQKELYYFNNFFLRSIQKMIFRGVRVWLKNAVKRPNLYIANSNYVANWHRETFGIEISKTIYPNVDTELFSKYFCSQKEDYYVFIGRLVEYKRVDLIVRAFNIINRKIIIIGDGKDRQKLQAISKSNIQFVGFKNKEEIAKILSKAKAFVFPGKEAFGIVNIEAQACGTPVICLGRGGTKETVIDGVTGVHFYEQTEEALIAAIDQFENRIQSFIPSEIRKNSERFSSTRFENEFKCFIEQKMGEFLNQY
jgi:glycosyltransferase involved in cell wall biosynthesis